MNFRDRNFFPAGIFVIASVAVLALCIPAAGASPVTSDQVPGLTASPVLNVTNASLENTTILSKYQVTPTPIKVGIDYEATLADAKGEMAAGPRTIGFSFSPVTLGVVLTAAGVIVAGIGWFAWRKRKEKDEEQ